MHNPRTILLALGATAIAVSGCGGTSGKPLSKKDFISKADAICKSVNMKREALAATVKRQRDYGSLMPRIAAYEHSAINELARLTPPQSLAADWKQILAADETLVADTLKYGQYIQTNNLRAARLVIQTAGEVEHPMQTTAANDGFKDCSEFT